MLNLNFDTIIADLTPIELRYLELDEWLRTLAKPYKNLQSDLNVYYDSIMFDVQHVGQVLSLEHYLNDYFGLGWTSPTVDRANIDGNINNIYIVDGIWYKQIYSFITGKDAESDLNNFGIVNPTDPSDGQMYIFDNSENPVPDPDTVNNPPVPDQIYLYNETEFNKDQIDFYIMVEGTWIDSNKEDKIKEIVNRYKKVGKKFSIVSY